MAYSSVFCVRMSNKIFVGKLHKKPGISLAPHPLFSRGETGEGEIMGCKQTTQAHGCALSTQQLASALARSLNQAVHSYVQPAMSSLAGSQLKGMRLLKLLDSSGARQAQHQLSAKHKWCSVSDIMIASARIRNIADHVELDIQLNAAKRIFNDVELIEKRIESLLRLNLDDEGERRLFIEVVKKLTPNALHQLEKLIKHQLDNARSNCRQLKQQMGAVLLAWRKLCLARGLLVDVDVLDWKRRYMASLAAQPSVQTAELSDMSQAVLVLMDGAAK